MPLDSQARLDDLLGILRTNTATIAASLTSATTINTVKQGDARSLPVTLGGYPAILVKLSRETESFQQIGQRLNRHELEFTIACIVYQGIDPQTSDEDCVTMTKNLKGVLKSNITLSNTAIMSIPETVDYQPLDLDGVYCSASLVSFRAVYLST